MKNDKIKEEIAFLKDKFRGCLLFIFTLSSAEVSLIYNFVIDDMTNKSLVILFILGIVVLLMFILMFRNINNKIVKKLNEIKEVV